MSVESGFRCGPPSKELREKDDGKPLARIEQRRKDTAKRLGVTNVAWAKSKNVSIAMLEIPAVAKKPGLLYVLSVNEELQCGEMPDLIDASDSSADESAAATERPVQSNRIIGDIPAHNRPC